jgi:transcriptional regulator with PAS, ATPase and Fis domain
MASGGTIFLDEVAEMSPDIQVKLLRALETRMVRRLGGKKEIQVDIRIVAATNKDLQKAIAEGELREDLYYRLAVVQIDLPPLRDRSQDIRLLATEFLQRYASQNNKKITDFDAAAWDWVLSYNWPGNVRELKNAVERSVIMARGDKIALNDIMPRHLRNTAEVPTAVTFQVGGSMAEARRRLVLSTLASNNGDLDRAARTLGMNVEEIRRELHNLLGGGAAQDGGDEDDGDGAAGAARAPRAPDAVPTRAASAPKKPVPKKK